MQEGREVVRKRTTRTTMEGFNHGVNGCSTMQFTQRTAAVVLLIFQGRNNEMLVLTRKEGESILIGGDVVIAINRITGNRVVIGISAPRAMQVLRGEVAANRPIPSDPGSDSGDSEQRSSDQQQAAAARIPESSHGAIKFPAGATLRRMLAKVRMNRGGTSGVDRDAA